MLEYHLCAVHCSARLGSARLVWSVDLRLTWQQQYCPWELVTVDALILTLSVSSVFLLVALFSTKINWKEVCCRWLWKKYGAEKSGAKQQQQQQQQNIHREREREEAGKKGNGGMVGFFFLWNYRLRDYLYVTFGLSSETRHWKWVKVKVKTKDLLFIASVETKRLDRKCQKLLKRKIPTKCHKMKINQSTERGWCLAKAKAMNGSWWTHQRSWPGLTKRKWERDQDTSVRVRERESVKKGFDNIHRSNATKNKMLFA